ncbi:MAG: TetR/AcrR family transcriptional regulator [Deltaproteobacteria bacterium]|jgi:AcrR family transcriptional regulator|nr:TetR/AcrR family transcriptional regulator [Deltaproteobacteria bacterium]
MAEPLVPKIQADGSSALEGLAEILDTAEWDERETQTAKRRPAGRIPLNEKVDTKELLYREAICVISEKGVKGATIREIAKRANLTPAMVHYHFKDKATLVSSTLTRYLKPISDSVWEAAELDIGPLEMLREFHLRLSEVFTKVRWYGSFWSRELAGVHGSQKPFMASLIGENRLKLFREKIELGQKQGLINPLVSPELVFPTLIALVYLPRISLEHWGKVWNTDIDEETVRRHVWGTIIDGLAAKDAGKLK